MKALKHPLDNIVYEKQKAPEKIHEYVTLDWENILPPPPSNSSQQTQNELDHVIKVSRLREANNWINVVKRVDTETWSIFEEGLASNISASDLKKLEKMVDRAWDIFWGVGLNIKRKFNRARPEQLRDNVNVMTTKSHQTPAYPSGHAMYGYTASKVISLFYPEVKDDSEKIAEIVAFARIIQGVHYTSDNVASKLLIDKLWENVGYKIFPDRYPASMWIEKTWINT